MIRFLKETLLLSAMSPFHPLESASLSIVFEFPQLKESDVHKVAQSVKSAKSKYKGMSSGFTNWYYALTDYQTGQCLEVKNNKDVTCTNTEWKSSGKYTLRDSDGCWVTWIKKSVIKKVTVVYPEDYKDLCLVVGGATRKSLINSDKTDAFFNGKGGKFSTIGLSDKNNKKVAHGIRIK